MSTTSSSRPGRGTYVARRAVVLTLLVLVLGGLVAGILAVVALATPAPPTAMGAAIKTAPPTPAPPGSPVRCKADDLELAATAPETAYQEPDKPLITLTITGTGRHGCIVDGADASRALTITADDGTRVWSSADCASDQRLLLVSHGDVDSRSIQWDRTTSTAGCKGKAKAVPAGSYTATVTVEGIDGLTSEPLRFTLVDAPEPTPTSTPSATASDESTEKSTAKATPTPTATPKPTATAKPTG